jgi:hypothetical protein
VVRGAIWISDELESLNRNFITTGTIPGYGVKQGGASYTVVAKVTMDLRLRESTHLQTKAEEKRRHGVPYGYGELRDVQSKTTTEFLTVATCVWFLDAGLP